jgi:hypothetical protein
MTRLEWFRPRWEGMRRDPKYLQAWADREALREELLKAPESEREAILDAIGEQALDAHKSFGVKRMVDPYEELSFNALRTLIRNTEPTLDAVDTKALSLWVEGPCLLMNIDFSKVNSIDAVIDEVTLVVRGMKEHIPAGKRNKADYDWILKVGDMVAARGDNPDYLGVAIELYPELDGDELYKAAERVRKDAKKYRELIEGGYMSLTYP